MISLRISLAEGYCREHADEQGLLFVEIVGGAGPATLGARVCRTARQTAVTLQFCGVVEDQFPDLPRKDVAQPPRNVLILDQRFATDFVNSDDVVHLVGLFWQTHLPSLEFAV